MAYQARAELYRQIEAARKRPLIAYITSARQNASGQIAPDVIPQLTKQLAQIPKDSREIDILIVSNGGDPTVSWRIISLLRERFDQVGALLPFAAFSAATLIALGADEIVMHPFANLGPVDPQLTYRRRIPGQPGQQETADVVQFGSEDLRNFMEYVREDVGISDQEQLEKAFELVCKEVGSIPIGVARRGAQLALSMGEQLLSLHMKDGSKAKAIAETLNKSFYHHGYPLGRKEVEKIGLPLNNPDEALEGFLWSVWEDVEEEMECNTIFDPLQILLQDAATAALLGPVNQVQMPANLPPQIAQQVLNNILAQINVVQVNPIDYSMFQATLESPRARSEFRTNLKISGVRLPDMNVQVAVVKTRQGWTFIP
jgi:hypothetical protein